MKPDEMNPQASPHGEAVPETPANDVGAPGDAPTSAAFEPESAPDALAALEAEKADLKDKLLRTLADMENMRRRTAREVADARAYGIANFARDVLTVADNFQRALDALPAEDREGAEGAVKSFVEGIELTEREVADARAYGIANFARDMLTVADNFQRAIDNVPAEAREGAEPAFKALIEGIELTERDMLKALERHGVKRLDPQGQKFDPNFHQAMFEVPDATVPTGTVVQVVQTGYAIGERVLRPALVGVAKGGPKAAATEGNGTGESAA